MCDADKMKLEKVVVMWSTQDSHYKLMRFRILNSIKNEPSSRLALL